jgi:Flp pilus assembly pilin Flp
MLRKLFRNRKGQGLVEYALIIAGVALIAAVGVSIFGHKVAGMIDMTAAVLPGAHTECNAPIQAGQLIETTPGSATASIKLDVDAITTASGSERLSQNLWGIDAGDLVPDENPAAGGGS